MPSKRSDSIKYRVATEAAVLLYTQQEKEYKQAKQHAAKVLGARTLPSNKEIAFELDRIADELEGPARNKRLETMRRDALFIMVTLGEFHPRLVGSVWRGTAHKNSDIDIEVFTSGYGVVLQRLRDGGYEVHRSEWHTVTKGVKPEKAFHINLTTPSKSEAEIIVRAPEKMNQTDKCEIYGDIIKGLDIHQLRRILTANPVRRFVPP